MSDNRKFLTKEQAIDFVGGKRDSIHCFVGNGGMVIGADWAWSEFENLLEKSDTIEEAHKVLRQALADKRGGSYD